MTMNLDTIKGLLEHLAHEARKSAKEHHGREENAKATGDAIREDYNFKQWDAWNTLDEEICSFLAKHEKNLEEYRGKKHEPAKV